METTHPRDRFYGTEEKITAVLNFINHGKLTTRDYFAIGIDTWKERGTLTDKRIREQLSAALLSIVEQKQVETACIQVSRCAEGSTLAELASIHRLSASPHSHWELSHRRGGGTCLRRKGIRTIWGIRYIEFPIRGA